jgi:hypothetical protein
MTSMFYVLRNRLAVPVDSVEEWGRQFETTDRRVIVEEIGAYIISTVFVGVDHLFGGELPLIFETIIFPTGTVDEIYCDRCGTWQEAVDMHERAVAHVLGLLNQEA